MGVTTYVWPTESSVSQEDAIESWVGTGFWEINNYMRYGEGNNKNLTDTIKAIEIYITNPVHKIRPFWLDPHNMSLYRGGISAMRFKDNKYTDKGFVAFSYDHKVGLTFCAEYIHSKRISEPNMCGLLKMAYPPPAYTEWAFIGGEEGEVLFMPTTFNLAETPNTCEELLVGNLDESKNLIEKLTCRFIPSSTQGGKLTQFHKQNIKSAAKKKLALKKNAADRTIEQRVLEKNANKEKNALQQDFLKMWLQLHRDVHTFHNGIDLINTSMKGKHIWVYAIDNGKLISDMTQFAEVGKDSNAIFKHVYLKAEEASGAYKHWRMAVCDLSDREMPIKALSFGTFDPLTDDDAMIVIERLCTMLVKKPPAQSASAPRARKRAASYVQSTLLIQ